MRPAKGQWVDEEDGQVYKERMIPVRFAVETEEQLQTVVEETFKHYDDQIAIMYYLISKDARITLRSEL